jgi:hypothetical protein
MWNSFKSPKLITIIEVVEAVINPVFNEDLKVVEVAECAVEDVVAETPGFQPASISWLQCLLLILQWPHLGCYFRHLECLDFLEWNSYLWVGPDQFQDLILEIVLELVSSFSILLWAEYLLDSLVINFVDFQVAPLAAEWAVGLALEDVEV